MDAGEFNPQQAQIELIKSGHFDPARQMKTQTDGLGDPAQQWCTSGNWWYFLLKDRHTAVPWTIST